MRVRLTWRECPEGGAAVVRRRRVAWAASVASDKHCTTTPVAIPHHPQSHHPTTTIWHLPHFLKPNFPSPPLTFRLNGEITLPSQLPQITPPKPDFLWLCQFSLFSSPIERREKRNGDFSLFSSSIYRFLQGNSLFLHREMQHEQLPFRCRKNEKVEGSDRQSSADTG